MFVGKHLNTYDIMRIKYWEPEVVAASIGQSANSPSKQIYCLVPSILPFDYHLLLSVVDAAGSYGGHDGCSISLQEKQFCGFPLRGKFHHTN